MTIKIGSQHFPSQSNTAVDRLIVLKMIRSILFLVLGALLLLSAPVHSESNGRIRGGSFESVEILGETRDGDGMRQRELWGGFDWANLLCTFDRLYIDSPSWHLLTLVYLPTVQSTSEFVPLTRTNAQTPQTPRVCCFLGHLVVDALTAICRMRTICNIVATQIARRTL
jgi:hypothetical protein